MRTEQALGVGIVGATDACAAHVAALRLVPHLRIVGMFDADTIRAKRASVACRIQMLPSIDALRLAGATVMHVLTPASTHGDLVTQAIDLGCHVFVDQPATTDVADCRAIANVAAARRLQVCVGHSLLFEPAVRRALRAIHRGKLGRITAIDFLRSTAAPTEARTQPAGAPFRKLAGDPLALCELLIGPIEHVQADWKHIGDATNLAFDEWRALVRCRDGLGQFHLSWNGSPVRDRLIIQGTGGQLQLEIPRGEAGLRNLIAAFYDSLRTDRPAPVAIADAKRIVQWTERIARLAEQDCHRRLTHHRLGERVPFLVTDPTTTLGRALVSRLRDARERVRVIVPHPPESTTPGVEAAIADLRDPDAVDRAIGGAHVVINTSTHGHGLGLGRGRGTEQIAHACLNQNVHKLVHVSSLRVLDLAGADRDEALRESSPLEPRPQARDEQTRAVLEAEQIVSRAAAQYRLPAVILRVGHLFGEGAALITPDIARSLGRFWFVLGNGRQRVPLLHIDDAIDAILRAASSPLAHGEIIHLVDDDAPMQNDVIDAATLDDDVRIIRLPRWLVMMAGAAMTIALRSIGRASSCTPYRLRCAMSGCTFSSDQRDLLDGWRPTVGLHGALLRQVSVARGRFARVTLADELLITDADLPALGTTEPRA